MRVHSTGVEERSQTLSAAHPKHHLWKKGRLEKYLLAGVSKNRWSGGLHGPVCMCVSCRGVTHREDVAMQEETSWKSFFFFSGESVVGLSQDLQSEMLMHGPTRLKVVVG